MVKTAYTRPDPLVPAAYTRRQQALWWQARLWDVAEGAPLTATEAQHLADWVK